MPQKIPDNENTLIKDYFKKNEYRLIKKRTFDFFYTKLMKYDYMDFKFCAKIQTGFMDEDGMNYRLFFDFDPVNYKILNLGTLFAINYEKILIENNIENNYTYHKLTLEQCFEIITKIENYLTIKLIDKTFILDQISYTKDSINFYEDKIFFSSSVFTKFVLGLIELSNNNTENATQCFELFVHYAQKKIDLFKKDGDNDEFEKYLTTRINISNEIIQLIKTNQPIVIEKYTDILSKLDKELKW